MDDAVANVCAELDAIVKAILAWGDERMLAEPWGFQTVSLNKHELAALFADIADRLRANDGADLKPELIAKMPDVQARLRYFRRQTIANLYNGNAHAATAPIAVMLQWLNFIVQVPQVDWEAVPQDELPQALRRRLRSVKDSLSGLEPDAQTLGDRIGEIKAAHEAALALPTDLQALRESKDAVTALSKESSDAAADIRQKSARAGEHLEVMEKYHKEAASIIEQTQRAYAAATTSGLAAAFDRGSATSPNGK